MLYAQSAFLRTLKTEDIQEWQDDLLTVALGKLPSANSENRREELLRKALEPVLKVATKGYQKDAATPLISIRGDWPFWVELRDRQAVNIPGWYLGGHGKIFNLCRKPRTTLAAQRLELWHPIIVAVVNDVRGLYGQFELNDIAAFVRAAPRLSRLARLAWDYSQLEPVSRRFAGDESRAAQHVRTIFDALSGHWTLIDDLWAERQELEWDSIYSKQLEERNAI